MSHRIVFTVLLLALIPLGAARAQSPGTPAYSAAEQRKLAHFARELVEKKYLTNLELLLHYEANQPLEALQDHLDGLVRDALRSPSVLVYNAFRQAASPYTTVPEYVRDSRIFSGGRPVQIRVPLDSARYVVRRTPTGEPFVSIYATKQLRGHDRRGKPFQIRTPTEFRVAFTDDPKLNTFYNFRLAGVSRADTVPTAAVTWQTLAAVPQTDLTNVVNALVGQLRRHWPATTSALTLERFTYQQCGITDALSDRLFATFSAELQRTGNVVVAPAAQADPPPLLVRGSYRQELNQLRLLTELYDPAAERVVAQATNAELPLAWLAAQGLQLVPDQYAHVVNRRDTLRRVTAQVVKPADLRVEIRTDRGRQSVEYWEGQTMHIDVKASQPCQLRVVYLLADGTRTILEADAEIRPGQEGRYVRIAPNATFECAAPFGTEHLLVYATVGRFCPLPATPDQGGYVRQEDGYTVFVGALADLIRLSACTAGAAAVAEDRLQITTRPRQRNGPPTGER